VDEEFAGDGGDSDVSSLVVVDWVLFPDITGCIVD
jgi:hypothetical protein